MQKILPLIMALILSACTEFIGVYKIDVEQGNIVTQEMVDQLKPGLSKSQVRYIMGSPVIQDTFNPDRWDYFYSMQRGGEERESKKLTLLFSEDKLVSFSGNYAPSAISGQTTAAE